MPRRPVGGAAAHLEEEVVQDLTASRGVGHLGMELNAEERALPVFDGRDRRIGA
jgi:hypothetical protein